MITNDQILITVEYKNSHERKIQGTGSLMFFPKSLVGVHDVAKNYKGNAYEGGMFISKERYLYFALPPCPFFLNF